MYIWNNTIVPIWYILQLYVFIGFSPIRCLAKENLCKWLIYHKSTICKTTVLFSAIPFNHLVYNIQMEGCSDTIVTHHWFQNNTIILFNTVLPL